MRDAIDQLRRNAQKTLGDRPTTKGKTAYAFPWSASFTLLDASTMKVLVTLDRSNWLFSRCPIYKRLNAAQRRELMLRAPKAFLTFRNYGWKLLDDSIDAYRKFEPGGVSPVTAIALLIPEPRMERRFGGLTDLMVIPEPIPQVRRAPRTPASRSRRRTLWPVVVWSLKRYAGMSWSEIRGLANDLKRGNTSLRQTIRFEVEQPLNAFYRTLTGSDLPPEAYQAALQDRPESPSWARDRMRDLKRSAHSKPNPTK